MSVLLDKLAAGVGGHPPTMTGREIRAANIAAKTGQGFTAALFEGLDHPKLRKYACDTNLRHGGTRNKAFELPRTPYHLFQH